MQKCKINEEKSENCMQRIIHKFLAFLNFRNWGTSSGWSNSNNMAA